MVPPRFDVRAGALLWALSACSSGAEGTGRAREDAGARFTAPDAPSDPCQSRGQSLHGLAVEGSGGLALVMVSIEPDPAVVGDNSWQIELSLDGEPLPDVAEAIRVSPSMPDHGHGSPVSVGITDLGEGAYRLQPVNTFMPGFWEIEVRVDSDIAEGSVQFGVCIE